MSKHLAVLLLLFTCLAAATDTPATWADGEWNTGWAATTVSNTCDSSSAFTYESTGGNPTHNWFAQCVGRNDGFTGHADWTGAWTDLGVTSGDVVSAIQMVDIDTNCVDYATCDTATLGPFELRDSGDTLVSTLWSGRTASSDEDAWTAEGSQTGQGCGSVCNAASSIELWINFTLDTGNNKAAVCGWRWDNLDINITHAAPPASQLNKMLITRVRFRKGKDGKIHPYVLGTAPAVSADRGE